MCSSGSHTVLYLKIGMGVLTHTFLDMHNIPNPAIQFNLLGWGHNIRSLKNIFWLILLYKNKNSELILKVEWKKGICPKNIPESKVNGKVRVCGILKDKAMQSLRRSRFSSLTLPLTVWQPFTYFWLKPYQQNEDNNSNSHETLWGLKEIMNE